MTAALLEFDITGDADSGADEDVAARVAAAAEAGWLGGRAAVQMGQFLVLQRAECLDGFAPAAAARDPGTATRPVGLQPSPV